MGLTAVIVAYPCTVSTYGTVPTVIIRRYDMLRDLCGQRRTHRRIGRQRRLSVSMLRHRRRAHDRVHEERRQETRQIFGKRVAPQRRGDGLGAGAVAERAARPERGSKPASSLLKPWSWVSSCRVRSRMLLHISAGQNGHSSRGQRHPAARRGGHIIAAYTRSGASAPRSQRMVAELPVSCQRFTH